MYYMINIMISPLYHVSNCRHDMQISAKEVIKDTDDIWDMMYPDPDQLVMYVALINIKMHIEALMIKCKH